MKFQTTTYGNRTEILAIPDHWVALPVMVSDSGVSADADGRKIVKAGTPVGGSTKSVLANPAEPVVKKNTGSTKATSKIVFGTPVADDTVTVGAYTYKYVAAPAASNEFSTIAELLALLAKNPQVTAAKNALDTEITLTATAFGTSGNGTILVSKTGTGTMTISAFADGENGTARDAEGILFNDCDVTLGAAPGSMLVHAFVDTNKLPEAIHAEAKAAMPHIVFRPTI